MIDWFILFLFILPYTFLWFCLFLYICRSIRLTLWFYTSSLLYSIHIPLLQYYDYFRLCELVYKALFLYHDIVSGSVGATTWDLKSASWFRKIISYVYYHPYILTIIFFFSLVLEVFLSGGLLYYGVYSLFIYPFVYSLFRCFHMFYCTRFIQDVCMSDYIALNFNHPRYYHRFWFYLPRAEYYFGFEYTYPPDLLDVIRKTCALEEIAYTHSTKYSDDLTNRVWGHKHTLDYSKTIMTGLPRKWPVRIAAFYWNKKRVRWYHTSTVLYSPISEKIHPLTIHFIKNNPYAILSLVNHPGQNFGLIQKVSKNVTWPTPKELYKDTSKILIENENKTLTDVLEVNLVVRFKSLAQNGVILGTYKPMKERFGYTNLETMQMRPDLMSWWLKAQYQYKGYLGIDQKAKNVTNFGRNQIITDPNKSYHEIIDNFKEGLETKYGSLTQEMLNVLRKLKKTSFNPEAHIQVWAESLHLFPDKWKPPLLLDKSFDSSNLKPEIIEFLRKGEAEIKRISDELYTLNISEETGSFDEKALDRFEGSFIQDLLK
jgi:hypothetical protein